MKRSQLQQIIREEFQGYSKYLGKTKGGTSDEFNQILTKIAKGGPQGDAERGNKVLDRANPNNVARIIRGEKPMYEEQGNLEKYKVFFYTGDDDHDWDVMATSEEDAIAKVQSGEVKGPYGRELPRLARKFSATKV
jgi:hypothetical protein